MIVRISESIIWLWHTSYLAMFVEWISQFTSETVLMNCLDPSAIINSSTLHEPARNGLSTRHKLCGDYISLSLTF